MDLVIIGAGPKAIAIGAKLTAIRLAGLPTPTLKILESHTLASAWDGKAGFTSGQLRLGTPPDKDVGFPYLSAQWGDHAVAIDSFMHTLSWQAFMIACRKFSKWVDAGRPQPLHAEWAEYLRWVAERCELSRYVVKGTLVEANVSTNGVWKLNYTPKGERTEEPPLTLHAHGIVFTGQGEALRIRGQPEESCGRIFDGRSYWQPENRLKVASSNRVAVIGGGETAASVIVDLLNTESTAQVDLVHPYGVLLSRGESYSENLLFSSPEGWPDRSEAHREELIRRGDRGVFSTDAQQVIRNNRRLAILGGKASFEEIRSHDVALSMRYPGQSSVTNCYDYVVVAIGFLPLTFCDFMNLDTLRLISKAVEYEGGASAIKSCVSTRIAFEVKGLTRSIERAIATDLSIHSLSPRLHLPMLSGLAQGPGFPNLSCLGLLADRILGPYVYGH